MTSPDPLPTDPTAPKAWTASRTLIVNAALTVVFALGLVGQLAGVFSIDPKWVALAGAAAAVINFYLRLDTNAAIQGTPSAAVAIKAKEDIALHAAVGNPLASAQPRPAAIPAAPTLDDLPALLAELKKRHDQDGALLAELAGVAGTQPVGAWTGPVAPPVATTPVG